MDRYSHSMPNTSRTKSSAVVTGALSYSGVYIARRLLEKGIEVRTITGHPQRPNPFGKRVQAFPYSFDDPAALERTLRGAHVLYNTYWVRFPFGSTTYETAVDNSLTLIECARQAGIERIVHVSIVNPSLDSPFPYFRGKAEVEEAIIGSGLSYAIVRPTVLFGGSDVLINNIAWLLRHFPVFAIPGTGEFPMQPLHVDDQARLCVEAGASDQNMTFDAAGPETYYFAEVVSMVREAVGSRSLLLKVPVHIALNLARLSSLIAGDVVLTKDEMRGLIAGMVVSEEAPRGKTSFREWLDSNADALGRNYASELDRHYRSGRAFPFNDTQ